MSIVDIIKNKPGFVSLKPIEDSSIREVENVLSVRINDEYKDCIKNFGIFSFKGHEFCGITTSKRLNIVDVTNKVKSKINNVKKDLYVIEELNIDDVVIWQNSKGEIYKTIGCSEPKKIEVSFKDYLEKETN